MKKKVSRGTRKTGKAVKDLSVGKRRGKAVKGGIIAIRGTNYEGVSSALTKAVNPVHNYHNYQGVTAAITKSIGS